MINVAITGHQDLSDRDWVKDRIETFLKNYNNNFRGLSCLARGADLIFAEATLRFGGHLVSVIPFPDYFDNIIDVNEMKIIDNILSRSTTIVTLPKADNLEESYYLAGKVIVESSEILLAVWDGLPAKGLGGTADIVKYASKRHKEIWHINTVQHSTRRI